MEDIIKNFLCFLKFLFYLKVRVEFLKVNKFDGFNEVDFCCMMIY